MVAAVVPGDVGGGGWAAAPWERRFQILSGWISWTKGDGGGGHIATSPCSYILCEAQPGTLFWGAPSDGLRCGGRPRLCDFWWGLANPVHADKSLGWRYVPLEARASAEPMGCPDEAGVGQGICGAPSWAEAPR